MHKQFSNSLQHWNVDSHNQFMIAFAKSIGESNNSIFVSLKHSDRMKADSVVWIERIQRQSEEIQSQMTAVVHQTQHAMQAQVMLMRDFDEGTHLHSKGFLDQIGDCEKHISLDLTPLIGQAEHLGMQIDGISLKALLLTDTYDVLIEQLSLLEQSKQKFVVYKKVNDKHVPSGQEFVIVKHGKDSYYYWHQLNEQIRICNPQIVKALEDKAKDNKPAEIERDDYIYSKIRSEIYDHLGDKVLLPFTSRQLLCCQQLQVLVAIRKSYHAIGQRCTDNGKYVALSKLYGQYIDDVLRSDTMESLAKLEHYMLIILPLDISWVSEDYSGDHSLQPMALQNSVEVFNRHPSLADLFEVILSFHTYHTYRLTLKNNRSAYIMHLNTQIYLGSLKIFCNQLCKYLRILCDEVPVDQSFQNVPSMASSETILHQITIQVVQSKSSVEDYTEKLHATFKKQSLVYTAVDHYFDLLIRQFKTTLKITVHRQNNPQPPPQDLAFEESFTLFETLPCFTTFMTVFVVYMNNYASNPPTQDISQVQHLLNFLYKEIYAYISSFDTSHSIHDLMKQLDRVGFQPCEVYKKIEVFMKHLDEQNPMYETIIALANALNYFHKLTKLPESLNFSDATRDNEHERKPEVLLVSITVLLENIHQVFQQGFEAIARNELVPDTLSSLSHSLDNFNNTLLCYPMSCQASSLRMWKQSTTKIHDKIDCYTKIHHCRDIVIREIQRLKDMLESFSCSCSQLEDLHANFLWIKHATDLDRYCQLCHADDNIKMELCIQWQLSLNDKFRKKNCIHTLSNWLGSGLVRQTPQRISVVTQRYMPKHDIIFVAKEPIENMQVTIPTIYMYPNDKDLWQLAFQLPGKSLQYRNVKDINDDIILSLTGQDIRKYLKNHTSSTLTEEKKACLLGKLRYEEEYTIQHLVYFDGQEIINELNTVFSMVVVKTQTCEINFYTTNDINKKKVRITDNELVIIQGQCTYETLSALQQLKITNMLNICDKDICALRCATAVCLIRLPGQRVELKTVSHCGDKVDYDFVYTMPLITDLTDDEIKTLSVQLQPLSTLLNDYLHHHHSMDVLNKALDIALTPYKVSLYHIDVFKLVRSIRRHFIEICFDANTVDSEPQSVKAMKQPLKLLLTSQCEGPVYEEMYLTGLESFSNFLNNKKKMAKSIIAERICSMERSIQYEIWRHVFEDTTLTSDKAICMYMAYAYLEVPDYIDSFLLDETVLCQLQTYGKVEQGLHMFKCYNKSLSGKESITYTSRIKAALQQISSYQKCFKIDALEEASQTIDDEKNLGHLLILLQSQEALKPVREALINHLEKEPLQDLQSCCALLKDQNFYNFVHGLLLSWCTNQQVQLLTTVQTVALDVIFAKNTHMATLVNTMSEWLMRQTGTALSEHRWEDILNTYEIGIMICDSLKSDALSLHKEKDSNQEHSDIVHNCLTLVQVIAASSDTTSVLTVLQESTKKQWLSVLFVQNFFTICIYHFDIRSQETKESILMKLSCIDSKLLQISYNVFVEDQFCSTDDGEESKIGMISEAQFLTIIDWLPYIEPNPVVCSTLCKTEMSMWDKVLAELHFKQYLDNWRDLTETDKKHMTYLLNRVRLEETTNFMSFLSVIKGKYISSGSQESTHLVNLVEDLYYKRVSLQQANDIILRYEYMQWSQKFTDIKLHRHDQCQPRDIDEILQLIKEKTQSHALQMRRAKLESIREEGIEIQSRINEVKDMTPFLQKEHVIKFKYFLQRFETMTEKKEWLESHRVDFMVHLVTAWMCVNNNQSPYNTQIVSLLLFLHNNDGGLLQQVKTGEGKTLIVGLLAAAKALIGFKVDIVSSNQDLAKEGRRKCKEFFEQLGLQAAVNCTDDDGTNQQAYKSHIVYGDVGSFQRDVLTGESHSDGTCSNSRYSKMLETCLIVDEVDSMFLDKGRHMLYLSHESPALNHLESLFMVIWSAVLSITPEEQNEQAMIDEMLEQTTTELLSLIKEKKISVPGYLTDFCHHKMHSWVRSAYQARFMDADDQFVIDYKSNDDVQRTKQIFPVDKQTGIEQYNMKWSNGLSQFLELKYRRKLSSESLKAIFISNKRFFKRYGTELYGLTGTLGSHSSCKLLQEVYKVSLVELPTNKAKRYIQYKSRVARDDREWCHVIYKEICGRISEQPILVICENIKRLNTLRNYLTSEKTNKSEIIDYARHGDNVETRFESSGALANQIILATNKGGRGTDIKVNIEVVPKGLHVIVSFLPENTRIEEQAFGRAARAGQAGSGCLIVQIDPEEYMSDIEQFNELEAATEILIEREKIKRDLAESERISLLLHEGIPQLDLEEKLYSMFQEQKRKFCSTLEKATKLAKTKGEETIGDCKEACNAVFIDHWAFWLDSMSHEIKQADSTHKRQALEKDFENTFSDLMLSPPSLSSADSKFFLMPEHCIQLGNACLKKKKFGLALQCFEKAIHKGDCTGLSPMAATYCYIKLNPKPIKENKKAVRCFLKKASSQMHTLRRNWMANGEIGKSFVQLLDVSQYVDDDENHYIEQIEDKLKVIGLHLNTLEILLGGTIDDLSFTKESELTEERVTPEHSKEIYYQLVKDRILCHNKVRKCWSNEEALELHLKEELEPTIADKLIAVIKNKAISRGSIDEKDLETIVHSSNELWELLAQHNILEKSESVVIVEVCHIQAKLPEESLKQSWKALNECYSDRLKGTSQLVLHRDDPIYKTLQQKDYEMFCAHLKTNALYHETQRAAIKHTEVPQFEKYEHCTVKDENGKDQSLRSFLVDLLRYCVVEEDHYFYEYMLPFECTTIETKKLHGFLREKDILKSGILTSAHQDGNELTSSVEKALDQICTKPQQAHVLSVLQRLPGEIRGFEREMKVEFVDFYSLEDRPDDIPESLYFFSTWHLDNFLTLQQEEKSWWDWNAFAVAMIGLAQVIAGAALVALTAGAAAQIGSGLISEGINDMLHATISGLTGTFSWKDWAIQKAISVAISIVTGGISCLASLGKAAVKVGSASRFCTFAKTFLKAAGEFLCNATAAIISDVVLADVQERIVSAIIKEIEKRIFTGIEDMLKSFLVKIAQDEANNDTFHKRCQRLRKKIEKQFQQTPLLPEAFDQIRTQVAASLQQNYRAIADSLSSCDSKWAKVAGAGVKAAFITDKVFNAVRVGLNVVQAVDCFASIVSEVCDCNSSTPASKHTSVDQSVIDRNISEMKDFFKEYIQRHIKKLLSGALKNIIKGSMKSVAKASMKTATDITKKAFHGKDSAQVVKDLQDRKKKQETLTDSGDHSSHEKSASIKKENVPKPSTAADEKQRAYQQKRESLQAAVLKPELSGIKGRSDNSQNGHELHLDTNFNKTATITRPLTSLSKEELSKVKSTLEYSNGTKFAFMSHTHHSNNKVTGYQYARRNELERMPMRQRADSLVNLQKPALFHNELHGEKQITRRATNEPREAPYETKGHIVKTKEYRDHKYRNLVVTRRGEHVDHVMELQLLTSTLNSKDYKLSPKAKVDLKRVVNCAHNLTPLKKRENLKKGQNIRQTIKRKGWTSSEEKASLRTALIAQKKLLKHMQKDKDVSPRAIKVIKDVGTNINAIMNNRIRQ